MKRIFCFIFFNLFCSYGYSQFMNGVPTYCQTPNGNLICDEPFYGCINDSLGVLSKWYFYKDRIIGISTNSEYFILHEGYRKKLYVTRSEIEWHEKIKKQDLEPIVWKNWHTMDEGNWGETDESELGKHWVFYIISFIWLSIYLLIRRNVKTLLYIFVIVRLLIFILFDWLDSI